MAFNLSALVGKTASTDVTFMDQTAKITYDPTVLTTENLNKADATDDAFFALFCDLVKSWDVTKGQRKVPLTPKSLEGIPLVFLRACFRAVMKDSSAGEADSNSNDG